MESKESQVHCSGEVNILEAGVVVDGRWRNDGDWRKRRKKWQLTAGAGVEGVVEIKIREEDFTWREFEQLWKFEYHDRA